MAIIFEFEYDIQVNGRTEKTICLGYQVHLPGLNSIGKPEDRDIEMRLAKGPGETLNREMIVSEAATDSIDQIFDFVLQAYVSNSVEPPDQKTLMKRTQSIRTEK